MKYKGKVVSGSSLLTILGVICFATVLVAGAIVFTSASWTNTVPSSAGSVAKPATGNGVDLPSNPAIGQAYTFRLTVTPNIDTSTGTVTVTITATGIVLGDVVLKYDSAHDGNYATTLTGSLVSTTITYTVTGSGSIAWTHGTPVNYDFQITYNTANTYSCQGNAGA